MALATIAVLFVLICMVRGRKLRPYYENLDEREYPLKDLYSIGFYLSSREPFKLRGNLERELRHQSKLFWDNMYADYYVVLSWAQFLTFASLIVAFVLCLAGLLSGITALLMLIVGALAIAATWNLTISKAKEAVAERRDECEYEFPTMVSKLALMVNAGMITRTAWFTVAYGKEGPLYDLMKKSCDEMNNGASEVAAINKFGTMSDSGEIKKFASTLIQGLERGGGELSSLLLNQTTELWNRKRQLALQKGEVAAGKLIIPIGVMFGGVIMIIMSAAMQSFSF